MKESNGQKLREILFFKPDLLSSINLIIAVVINLAGFFGARSLDLPLWLDTIGTMMIAITLGPLAAILVSVASQMFIFIPLGLPVYYYFIGISVALIVGFLFPKKDDFFTIVTVAMLTALATSLLSCPLNAVFNDGYPGNLWGDQLFMMLSRNISSKGINAYISAAFIDFPDRLLSLLIAYSLLNLHKARLSKKKKSEVPKILSAVLSLILAANFLSMNRTEIRAFDYDSDFDTVNYGADDGLLTSEVNAVAQTRDGYLWVGTYAGLYKYNGIKFSEAKIDSRIRNVTSLFVDSGGKLWIGTNDSGAFCYDPETEEVASYSTSNGLSADSIRSICEDKNGNIYLGTVMSVSRIDPLGTVKSFTEWKEIFHVVSLDSLEDGSIVGVTNTGKLFIARSGLLIDTKEYDRSGSIYYLAAACSSSKKILVTTSENEIIEYEVNGDTLCKRRVISTDEHKYFSNIRYSDQYHGFFYCGEYGFGYIDESTGKVSDMTEFGFRGSVCDVCVDDQGNIWFASNKLGILKCSHTPFRYLFYQTGVEETVANAVCESDGLLYVGTDTGMSIINIRSHETVFRPWLKELENVRVRNLMKDSKGNLWISTYSSSGLIKVDPSGQLTYFNEENGNLPTGKIRSTIELSDGRILVSSNMGLAFVKDDEVVATLGEKDGLNNQFILHTFEREDGSILVASDGDGIYIIKNDRVAGHISTSEGLNSSVVLRIVKGSSGYFYVTSNAIYYDDGTGIRALKNFPYSNNYDILISEDGMCWITSSAGLYVVPEKTLIEDGEYTCTLLNMDWGLNTTFTANSWNLLSGETLYLCCTTGVRVISTNDYSLRDSHYQIHLESLTYDNTTLHDSDGKFIIPATNGRISFHLAVNNYTLSNPLIHYYLEGANDSGITCHQSEITPLEFTNLGYGSYKLHVQVINETTGDIDREEIFSIEKKAMMNERIYFQLYLLFVIALLATYVIWLFVTINKRAAKIRGLQKEMSTDPMTGLYNKSASEKVLTQLCSEETGILLMIDLDSFKLVNDIYGHDMGDKILIRFAELIRSAVGEGNMGGRLGGDEFIGFIKNTIDEEDVEQVTKYLNREIVASAKEYMGADMNIPLGASVGAVRVPNEGKEFDKLFRYADKALYIVKQNGKHGYAFYQKSTENQELEASNADKNNLAQIKKIIGERNEGKGAYLVNFEKLQVIYKYLCRNNRATGARSGFVRISLTGPDEIKVPDEARDAFEEVLISGLKKNDVVSRYSGNFYVIFNGGDPESYEGIVKRITAKWKENAVFAKYEVTTEIESVG